MPAAFRQGLRPEEPNPIEAYLGSAPHQDKIKLLREGCLAARSASPYAKTVTLNYNDVKQDIIIANTEGQWSEDSRTFVRYRVRPTLMTDRETFGDFFDFNRACGMEAFRDGAHLLYIEKMMKEMETTLLAPEAPGGVYPVVLEVGACIGTFFHECCGHQFETNTLASGGVFWDKRGQQIASERVTMIDDGTIPHMYGSSRFDDEGMPRQKNILIENGVMKNVLAGSFFV